MRLYNAGHHLESHEAFEEQWMVEVGPRKVFTKGLVHTAMAFHYLLAGDLTKGRSLLVSGGQLLGGFPDDYLGLDVEALRKGIEACRALLESPDRTPGSSFPRALIPPMTAASTSRP